MASVAAIVVAVASLKWHDRYVALQRQMLDQATREKDVVAKEKDATIEALKQSNETLKLYDVKEVNARYNALREVVKEMAEIEERLAAQVVQLEKKPMLQQRRDGEKMAALSKASQFNLSLAFDVLRVMRESPLKDEYLEKLAEVLKDYPTSAYRQLDQNPPKKT